MHNKYLSWKLALQLIGIAIFVIFILTIDVQELINSFAGLSLSIIALVLVLLLINLLIKGIRWQYIVFKYTGKTVPTGQATASIVAGVAAGSIFPGRVEPAKPMLLKESYEVPLSEGMSAMMIERIFDLLALVLIFVATSILILEQLLEMHIALSGLMIFVTALTIMLLLFLGIPDLFNKLIITIIGKMPISDSRKGKFKDICHNFFESVKRIYTPRAISSILILSIVAMLIEVIRLYALFQFFREDHSLILLGFALCFGVLAGIASLIPGGVGVNELTESGLIDAMRDGGTSPITSVVVLIDRIFAFYLLVVLGGFILLFSNVLFKPESSGSDI